jgi:hypothetical protein
VTLRRPLATPATLFLLGLAVLGISAQGRAATSGVTPVGSEACAAAEYGGSGSPRR